ncbi:hypothetical protein FSC37_05420 [Piscinibacter aquaticus]|uniref:Uncharacterized protein n=1 Tax=Piscinibacter aquaticus TaxID=392597 RepID=A0A5C6U1X6_9BURK|nr:hypothetical protein FSC37_05420 [Piscinibacter aquaticus]
MTTSDTVEPAGRLVVPVMVGVASFVSAGASTVSDGAVTSTAPESLAEALLPAASVAVATALKPPSASAAGTSTEKVPPVFTVAVRICVTPAESVITRLTDEPAGKLVVPLIVGVASLVRVGASMVRLGAVRSMAPPSLALALLPKPSEAVATTL